MILFIERHRTVQPVNLRYQNSCQLRLLTVVPREACFLLSFL